MSKYFFGLLVAFFFASAVARAQETAVKKKVSSRKKSAPTDVFRRIETLVENLQRSVTSRIEGSDSATVELNRRLDELSHEVKQAMKTVERGTSTSDEQVRRDLRRNIQSFTGYVQSLSEKVFRQVNDTARELSEQAQEIQ